MDKLLEVVDMFRQIEPDELLAAKAAKRPPDEVYSYTISVWGVLRTGRKIMFNVESDQVPGYDWTQERARQILATAVLASIDAGLAAPGWSNGLMSAWPVEQLFHVEQSAPTPWPSGLPFGQNG